MTEGKAAPDPVAIDAPGGFLFELWSVFWDIFIARINDKHPETASAYIETQQIKAKEEQQQQMQQLQLMRLAQLQRCDSSNPPLGCPLNSVNPEGMLGQVTASALAEKMYEDHMKQPNSMDSETSQPLLAARMALLKSTTNQAGQLVQGNSGSVNAALQQIQARSVTPLDIKGEVMGPGSLQRSLPMDTASVYGSGIMQSKPGMGNSGLSPGASTVPFKGWPLTGGMDHFGDIGCLEDNVESFLSCDDHNGRDLFGPLKRNPSEHAAENSKGFSFDEVGSIRKSNSKVVCCHFSSDGKLLASAGHDKKTMQTEITSEDHNLIITDVRFRPNSTQLATSSYDTTVRLWHAAQGGSAQVRFQPRIGHFLAAATENVVSIFAVDTDRQTRVFKGHSTEVNSLWWDANGDILASVSQDSVRVCH